ncbi:MAG: hypothetical protein O3A00_12595 [Planctomycetota bacterium]|nr:hypothetical protein [Planctomycetota bacterium]
MFSITPEPPPDRPGRLFFIEANYVPWQPWKEIKQVPILSENL